MFKKVLAIGFFSLFSIGAVNASLITSTGDINGLDLRWGKSESNLLQSYDESQGVNVNGGEVFVDFLLNENLSVGDNKQGLSHSNSGLTLSEGRYNSHLLHFDPFGTSKGSIESFSVSFTENIVAIILGGEYLRWSDDLMGGTGTTYQQSNSRRLESHDFFSFESANTLSFDKMRVGKYWIDEVRVITQEVPEPSSLALFALGILGISALSMRRFKR